MRLPTNMFHYEIEYNQIDGFEQDSSNFIANALKLLQFCTKPSKCSVISAIGWY